MVRFQSLVNELCVVGVFVWEGGNVGDAVMTRNGMIVGRCL